MQQSPISLTRGLRIFFIVFFFSLISVVFVTYLSYQSSSGLIQKKVANSSLEAITQTARQLDLYLQSFVGMSTQIRMNPNVMDQIDVLLTKEMSYNERSKVLKQVNDILNSYRDADRESIYSIALIPKVDFANYSDAGTLSAPTMVRSLPGPSIKFNDESSNRFQKIISADGKPVWFPSTVKGFFGFSYIPTLTMGKLMKNLKHPEREVVLLMEISEKQLWKNISQLKLSENGNVFMYDENSKYVAIADPTLLGQNAPFGTELDHSAVGNSNQIAIYEDDGGSELVVRAVSEVSNWMVVGTIPVAEMVGEMQGMLYYAAGALVALALVLVLATILSSRFMNVYRQSQMSMREIERQVIQLNEMARLKDDFLANTSHELRTPLNGIIGIAESLKDGIAGKLSDVVQYNLGMVISSGRRLLNLVNDILDFSKMKSHNVELHLQSICLQEIADLVIMMFIPLANQKNITITNSIPNNLPPVWADANRLQQIMYNLIGNALKFTQSGSVILGGRNIGSLTLLTVKDTGIGISPEMHQRIFESFEQGEGDAARKQGGTGLGLAVTKQLVTLHGGEISVDSFPGQGSTFTVTFPTSFEPAISVAEAMGQQTVNKQLLDVKSFLDEPVQPTTSADEIGEGTGYRVLIVDDEPINLQVLENHLKLKNYQVYQASSGMDALAWLNAYPLPDVVVLDVMMPEMTGFEVCKILRKKYNSNELPILLLTAKNQVNDLMQGFDVGANDYLVKPFTKQELLKRVRLHIQISRWNRTLEEQVSSRTKEIRNLLDAAGQGFLSVGADLKIDPQYSVECDRIFGEPIVGKLITDILFPAEQEVRKSTNDIMQALFAATQPYKRDLMFGLLPIRSMVGNNTIDLEYRMIEDSDHVMQKLMVIMTDVTEKLKLENDLETEKAYLRMIVKTVTNRTDVLDSIHELLSFISDSNSESKSQTTEDVPSLTNRLMRTVHTYKGQFAMFSFVNTPRHLHELEEQLTILSQKESITAKSFWKSISFEALNLALEQDLMQITTQLGAEYFSQSKVISVDPERLRMICTKMEKLLDREDAKILIRELKSVFFELLKPWVLQYESQTIDLASRIDKNVLPFIMKGQDVMLDRKFFDGWYKSLVHIFRNMVDHGIQLFEERITEGKSGSGKITCDVNVSGPWVEISFEDDGDGISVDRLKRKLSYSGVKTELELEMMSDEQIIDLIFEPNVSTAEKITTISGRGIGLSAVREVTQQIGGTVHVETEKGAYTKFVFRFPANNPYILLL